MLTSALFESSQAEIKKAYAPPPRKKAELDNMRLLEGGPDHIDYNIRLGIYSTGVPADEILKNVDVLRVLRPMVELSKAKESYKVLMEEAMSAFLVGLDYGKTWGPRGDVK